VGAAIRPARREHDAPWLAAVTLAYLVWSLAPLALAVLFSFNAGPSITHWEGFSLHWWTGADRFDPGLLHDPDLRTALLHSLLLATVCTVVAVPVGTAFALGARHWRGWPARLGLAGMLVVLALPPIALGSSLWLLFAYPLRHVPFGDFGWFGTPGQLVGLITLFLPLASIVVFARLLFIDPETEVMAADLGAPPGDVVRRILLPQLEPAILAATAVVFAGALGEFVVVDKVVGTNATRALAPFLLGAANNPAPIDNAVGTLLAAAGLVAAAVVVLAFRGAIRSGHGR
jgi:spermidine/putrescine transport system permease protein